MSVEFEARRVAAAFGVGELYMGNPYRSDAGDMVHFVAHEGGLCFAMLLHGPTLYCIYLSDSNAQCQIQVIPRLSLVDTNHKQDLEMARGLYRLGFDHPAIWQQLPPLSAHERLELRLSLPREFWPLKWLEEEP